MASADASELARIALFASLSESERAEVAGWFEVKDVGAEVQLVGEGATGSSFFVVAEGELRVSVGGEDVASLEAGDFFGEMALLGGGRRTATVTTRSPARVLVAFGDDLRRLREAHPAIGAQLDSTMRQRLEELET
jgi:CRP-like cAMP-binding protein